MIALLFLIFLAAMGIGIPIAFSMSLSTLVMVLMKDVPSVIVFQRMVAGVNTFPLLALPLFVLAGAIMEHGGISKKLMGLVNLLVGHVTGGLAMVACLSSALFGFVTGSGVADVAAIGSITMPEMVRRGYSKSFAACLQACAGQLGGFIPPSIILVVIGVAAGGSLSIGKLFLGAVIPGFLTAACLMIAAYIISKKRNYKGADRPASSRDTLRVCREAILPLFTPVIVLGGMYSGLFTPTEAAGVAVVYALFLGMAVYRTIKIRDLFKIFRQSCLVSCAILIIISCGATFTWFVAAYGGAEVIKSFLFSITENPYVMISLIMVIFLILGMVMEGSAAVVIFIPILMPIVISLGFNPTHFAIVFALNLGIGVVTPPVAVCLMTACRVIDIPYPPPMRDLVPFLIAMVFALAVTVAFPPVTLWLGG